MDSYDAVAMRRSLERGRPGYLDQLSGASPEYPHYSVMQSYFLTDSPQKRADWMACLRLLVAHRAPLDHGRKTAAELVAFGAWGPQPELTQELVGLCLDAGYLNVAGPLAGAPAEGEHAHPILLAIGFDNHQLLQLYLDRRCADGHPPVEGLGAVALSHADRFGSDRCAAVIKEVLMAGHMREGAHVPCAAQQSARVRRRL